MINLYCYNCKQVVQIRTNGSCPNCQPGLTKTTSSEDTKKYHITYNLEDLLHFSEYLNRKSNTIPKTLLTFESNIKADLIKQKFETFIKEIKCECGAHKTNSPNLHAHWCPKYEN